MKKKFDQLVKSFFFATIVRFVVLILIGLNVRDRQNLPKKGPAIIVANHNSHLDTLVLMHLLSNKLLSITHPVAAADYFLKNRFLSWFSQKIIGIIPIYRKEKNDTENFIDPFEKCYAALDKGEILILFPEGTRGEPEQLAKLKKGIAHLAAHFPKVPVIPVFMYGLGKALPKGEIIFVPFFCDVYIGEPIYGLKDKDAFMNLLQENFKTLANKTPHQPFI